MSRKPTIHREHMIASSKSRSLNKRILRVVTLTVFALLAYFLVTDYYTTINHAEKLTLNRLRGIVKDVALQMDGNQHLDITKRYRQMDDINYNHQEEDYKILHNILARTYVTHNLSSPIYTFIKSEKNAGDLQFVATSSEEPYYRHTYTSFPDDAFKQLDEGGTLGLYKDEFGHWISAFAPIKSKSGKIIAYVQADEKFDRFINEVRAQTMLNGLYCLIGFVFIIILLLPYLRQLLKEEEEQKIILEEALTRSKKLSDRLERSEQALKENARKLKQSNKDLTDFAHIASHDLKAPIRNIGSFAQLLQRRSKDILDESTHEYINFIITSSNRAQRLINGLLSYSTVDKDLGEQKVFYMCEAVEEARQSLVSVIEERRARVTFKEMIDIKANPTLVSQVFQNLINNGIKYNETSMPHVELGSGIHPHKGTYFYVKDNGIGIAPEYQKDIFKMFTRLHSSQHYEGSGIGLAFCHRVVKAYGGKMWLESIAGEGSTFFFTLPNAMVKPEMAMA